MTLALSLTPTHWLGMYSYLLLFPCPTINDHPTRLALQHYLASIKPITYLSWLGRSNHRKHRTRVYACHIPAHVGRILWDEMQATDLHPYAQDFLIQLDKALKDNHFNPKKQ